MDSSSSEGEEEKNFIFPDYISEESSESSAYARISAWAVRESHPGKHTVPSGPCMPPKHPRPHQQPEHCTFLTQAVPRHQFLKAPVPQNKPVSQAGQAIQACFIADGELREQAEENHVLVFHMLQVPLSPYWQHMLE